MSETKIECKQTEEAGNVEGKQREEKKKNNIMDGTRGKLVQQGKRKEDKQEESAMEKCPINVKERINSTRKKDEYDEDCTVKTKMDLVAVMKELWIGKYGEKEGNKVDENKTNPRDRHEDSKV